MSRRELRILERDDETGQTTSIEFLDNHLKIKSRGRSAKSRTRFQVIEFVRKVFLPAGYPGSVSSDYLRYQILNSLQAFCSSLAGLLSSRAVLEGFGVGKADASATQALLLTVLQDFFSRMTTIFGAYLFGSSLGPEAKTFRLLADVLNDGSIILDTLSPLFNSPSFPLHAPGLRIGALCVSGSLRALCGIAAGGSKAALAVHFSTPASGTGDIGDLNAKDNSKETVLALLGMLLGTVIVPYLTTAWTTYTVLFILVALHLGINYMGVRGLVLRSLNRQRTGLVWTSYRQSNNTRVASPVQISEVERIFESFGILRDASTGRITGHCTIGSSLSAILVPPVQPELLEIFKSERYVLLYDPKCLCDVPGKGSRHFSGFLRLHICLKVGHSPEDHLKAWAHASEVGRMLELEKGHSDASSGEEIIRAAYDRVDLLFAHFISGLRAAGWNTTEGALMTGLPRTVLTSIDQEETDSINEKKDQ